MTNAASRHRALDRAYAETLARDGVELGHGGALTAPRLRLEDMRVMTDHKQSVVLFATLTECRSARGSAHPKSWAGASNLVGFLGDDDEQGRKAWHLYLAERRPKEGASATEQRHGR